MIIMSDCSSCPSKGKCSSNGESCGVKNNPLNNVKHIIGVMSGKGGVGKSTVSAMLAKSLKKKGYSVGLLDADVTGPSGGRLMGLKGKRAFAENNMIIPVESPDGIKVMSLNFMLEDENQPVVWRGSLLSSCVTQFWTETYWGDLDYLIIDMPPGTGDITLTVMQSIPVSGLVMVSVPQDMVNMIVTKSVNMAKMLKIPVYGVVENMSYITCPHCNEKIKVFADDNTEEFLNENQIELLGELPTTTSLSSISDMGLIVENEEINKTFDEIADKIINK